MKLKPLKPRNPYVALALKRRAGTHTKTHKQMRGRLNRQLDA